MTYFFENNLPLKFPSIFKRGTGRELECTDSTAANLPVGIMATFDPLHKRYILHKKDYSLTEDYDRIVAVEDTATYVASRTVYVDTNNNFYLRSPIGALIPTSITDSNVFKNESWTLSYSIEEEKWKSFHSYLPQFLYNNNNNFYAGEGNIGYQHNSGDYTSYYGNKYPFYVEGITTSQVRNFSLDSVEIHNDCKLDGQYIDQSFNEAWVYTPRQSTGAITLSPYSLFGNTLISSGSTVIREIQDSYRFNVMRSRLNGLPSFIPGIHNEITNISPTDNLYESARMKGEYFNIRLTLDTTDNIEFDLHSILLNKTNSNR